VDEVNLSLKRLLALTVAIVLSLVVLKTAGLLISAIVAGLSVGVALGGRLSALGEVRFRAPVLFAAGVLLGLASTLELTADLRRVAYVASFWLLVAFAGINLRLPGGTLVALGLLAQALEVTLNGGAMPYSTEAALIAGAAPISQHPLQTPLASHTLLPFLADIVPFPFNGRAYSLGDLLIAAGLFRFAVLVLRGATSRDRLERHPRARGEEG
jgi:hypothetical protein